MQKTKSRIIYKRKIFNKVNLWKAFYDKRIAAFFVFEK